MARAVTWPLRSPTTTVEWTRSTAGEEWMAPDSFVDHRRAPVGLVQGVERPVVRAHVHVPPDTAGELSTAEEWEWTRCCPGQFVDRLHGVALGAEEHRTAVHRGGRVDARGVGPLPDRCPGVDVDAVERAVVIPEEGHAAVDGGAGVDRGVGREVVQEVEEVAAVDGDVGDDVVVVGLRPGPRRRVAELAPVVGDDHRGAAGVPRGQARAVSPVGPKSALTGMVTGVAGIVPWAVATTTASWATGEVDEVDGHVFTGLVAAAGDRQGRLRGPPAARWTGPSGPWCWAGR